MRLWCKPSENMLASITFVTLKFPGDTCMPSFNPFKWKQFQPDIILLCTHWYLRYSLTYRDLVEMMAERGLRMVPTTVMRWVHQHAPELEKRTRPHLKATGDSWKVDETYVKIKGKWCYLYRAVDKEGNTIDFYLSTHRDQLAAMRFLKKALSADHNTIWFFACKYSLLSY